MGFMLKRNHYGSQAALLCQLEITYDDGSKEIIGSDGRWKCSESAITFSEIYDGEIYDARNEEPQWTSPGFDDSAWEPVSLLPTDYSRLKAQDGEPIRRISSIPAQQLMITLKATQSLTSDRTSPAGYASQSAARPVTG